MKSTNNLLYYLVLISFSLIFFSCGETKDAENNDEKVPNKEEAQIIKKDLKKIITDVPEPSEIPYIIVGTGADYNPKIVNDVKKAEQYKTTDNKAALNLGVYATDLGYVCVYEKVNEALQFLNAAKSLTDRLDISNAFEPQILEKFQKNLKNVDTLTNIVDNALSSSDKYLKDGKRNKIAALIFAGSFIEGLHVSLNIITEYNEDLPQEIKDEVLLTITREVLTRKKGVENLYNAIKQLESDDDIKKMLKHLEELKKLYEVQNIEEKIKNNTGDFVLTADKNLLAIAKKVREIREEIVN